MVSSDSDKIRIIIEKEGINPSLFADKIGVSRGMITHVLSGRNNLSREAINKILETFPAINADWLLIGKDPMYDHEKRFLHSQKEPTLFDEENQLLNPQKNDTDAHKDSKVSEYPQKSIDKEPVESTQPVKIKEVKDMISSNRKIDKIIIFYDDKTFMSFSPEE